MTLSKLNFKRTTSAIFGLVIILIFASLIVGSIYARVDTTFQYGGGWVSAVDLIAKTVTVSYPQPAAACSESFCPKGKTPDVLKQGEALVTNAKDWVENDITKMKVGDGVIVYFQVNNSKTTPYAVKDFNLYEECDGTITSPCGGYGTITPR